MQKWLPAEDDELRRLHAVHGNSWKEIARHLEDREDWQCRVRYLDTLDPSLTKGRWQKFEDEKLRRLHAVHGRDWRRIAESIEGRTARSCRSRWPSLDPTVTKGLWTAEEDKELVRLREAHEDDWATIGAEMEGRTSRQCHVRWKILADTSRKRGLWTEHEDDELIRLHELHAGDWEAISQEIPGRSFRQCERRWSKNLDPSISRARWTQAEDDLLVALRAENGHVWTKIAKRIPGRCKDQCRARWLNVLDPAVSRGAWAGHEDVELARLLAEHGDKFGRIARDMEGRSALQCRGRWGTVTGGREWTEAEEERLLDWHAVHGTDWDSIGQAMKGRTPHQCRFRWFTLGSPPRRSVRPEHRELAREVARAPRPRQRQRPWTDRAGIYGRDLRRSKGAGGEAGGKRARGEEASEGDSPEGKRARTGLGVGDGAPTLRRKWVRPAQRPPVDYPVRRQSQVARRASVEADGSGSMLTRSGQGPPNDSSARMSARPSRRASVSARETGFYNEVASENDDADE